LEDLFLEADEIAAILSLWTVKKNVILQGPPGVGKSFAAQRLAYGLLQARDPARVAFVQFHQSYSYEDFVEGFRPSGDGFVLRQGKFVEFCRRAARDPQRRYVFIIDEINRGNLSKILGELMLLIESDKRDEKWAMPLAYGNEGFHVPSNVFLMGLMNTADRSLAVVDYALRRRFAFVELKPKLHSPKLSELLSEKGVPLELQVKLLQRIGALNEVIEGDLTNLGPGFSIGHSFFCAGPSGGETADGWYRRVITTEILPLLREYWFDAPAKAQEWEERLLSEL
jgi:5-methylcytosine-specific restriction endonuclease McrBC GTP-binding regulatory subunit McrB